MPGGLQEKVFLGPSRFLLDDAVTDAADSVTALWWRQCALLNRAELVRDFWDGK